MTDEIKFGSIETGECASIRILGGADKVSVCLYYGSTEAKHYDIYLHPTIFQEMWDRIHNIGAVGLKTPREYYNAKIRDVVKSYSVVARNYVSVEREKLMKSLEELKTEQENYDEYKKYINSLISEITGVRK